MLLKNHTNSSIYKSKIAYFLCCFLPALLLFSTSNAQESYADFQTPNDSIISENPIKNKINSYAKDSIDYDFSVMVEDFNGNKTEKTFIESLKPLFEEKIDKTTWTLDNALSIDGNAWEGLTENFWDDVIDTKDSPADNSYFIINRDNNGGMLNYPLDIVIDLNKSVILNRFVVWQRAPGAELLFL